ncbi:MAG: ABC transporter ATP-binding protein [Bacteroidota bacterium]|nr:ABC transporter ATP-binding protein [Bacteroidota bacterium]
MQDISFKISKGDFVCLIGKNGSGKTTLLKTICKIITPDVGKIFIEDKDIKTLDYRTIAKHISVVFQNTFNDLNFKVWDIVLMGRMAHQTLWQKDSEADENICLQSLRETNTLHLKDKNFSLLSAGEQQRVLIARALSQDAEIMLLDEPVSNLDIKHQFEIMDMLKQINKTQNKTIFIILHDLNLCLQYANKILALKEGELLFSGQTKDVMIEKNIETLFEVKAEIIDNQNIILKR